MLSSGDQSELLLIRDMCFGILKKMDKQINFKEILSYHVSINQVQLLSILNHHPFNVDN